MLMSTEKLINTYVNKALKSKQEYRENLQVAFEVFVSHYNRNTNKTLNLNSTPLFNILKASGKDITAFKNYVYKVTNITDLVINKDFNGIKLTFKQGSATDKDNPLKYDDALIDSLKWYNIAEEDDKKAVKTELDDKGFYRILNGLLKRVNESNKLTINKDKAVKTLTELTAQSKQAIDVAKA